MASRGRGCALALAHVSTEYQSLHIMAVSNDITGGAEADVRYATKYCKSSVVMPNGVQETFVCFVTCVYWVLKPSYNGSVKWHHRRRRSRRYASNYWKSTVVMLLRPGTVWVAKLLLEGHLTVYFIFLRFAFPKGFGSRPYWASDHLSNGSPGIAEVLQYQQIYTFAAIIVQERPSMVCISERPCWASDHLPDGSPGIAARSRLEGPSIQNCYPTAIIAINAIVAMQCNPDTRMQQMRKSPWHVCATPVLEPSLPCRSNFTNVTLIFCPSGASGATLLLSKMNFLDVTGTLHYITQLSLPSWT